jgi:PIN domain nuclease of toxin-antitoxin system
MQEDRKISEPAARALERSGVRLFVSVVSIWEILTKRHAGKLLSSVDPDSIVGDICSQPAWRILSLDADHLRSLNAIARFSDHTDPFDRMLIAQARHGGFRMITADSQFSRYGIEVIW